MASTYSPLLRYELIGAGEQAGIWGNTTNVNIGSLIEQSIAGVTNIDATALGGTTYVLEALNGAPDEARSMVLNFTGSAASAFTVVVPTSQKLYVVRNNTGQTINFKTAAQVSPQPVENANSTMIFCDGSDVRPGIAAPAVGTLTVAGGGTGSTTFTAGFIKSPGGTGALTSSASVNLAGADVSGILTVDKGGTGVASPASGRLLVGAGASAMTQLAGSSAGNFVSWSGSAWTESALLGPIKGGTGLSSYSTGQILYASGSNTLAALNPGSTGQVLTISGGIPTWATPTTGSVSAVTASAPLASSGGNTPNISIDTSNFNLLNSSQTITGAKGYTNFQSFGVSTGSTFVSYTNTPAYFYAPGSSAVAGYFDSGNSSLGCLLTVNRFGTSAIAVFGFGAGGLSWSEVGRISTNGTGVTYGTSSDYRLKDSVEPLIGGIEQLKKFAPKTFIWKNAPEIGRVQGFIAHEVQEVLPEAVDGEKDAVDKDGKLKIQTVDYAKLVPMLTAALQEAVAKIEALEERVKALGG